MQTTKTLNAIEDLPQLQEHQFMLQAKAFVKAGHNPTLYYSSVRQSLPQVSGVENEAAIQLLESIEMALINLVSTELNIALSARKGGDTKAMKPADIYRKYAKDLRLIIERGADTSLHAQEVLTEVYLEQSLSEGDLHSPDYRDPYTGEPIFEDIAAFEKSLPDRHEAGFDELLKFISMVPDTDGFEGVAPILPVNNWQREMIQAAQRCKTELGWDDDQVAAFLKANSDGFDAVSDDIPLDFDTTHDYTPPTLLPNELVLNKPLFYSTRTAVTAFNSSRSEIFERMGILKIKQKDWLHEFRMLITVSEGYETLIEAIKRVALEDVVTAATVYLGVAGEFGLMPKDIAGIMGLHEDHYVSVAGFAEEWEDDLLALHQDSLFPTSETSPRQIEAFSDDTLDDIRATMPERDHNPVNTASWNMGFILAVMGGADWRQADDAAWANWRKEMDAKAAEMYDKVFVQTGSRTKAMSAFWRSCSRDVPRPRDKIKSIARNKHGLILESGRQIDWYIVTMKIKGGELDLSGDTKPRLLAKLKELNIGKRVWNFLK